MKTLIPVFICIFILMGFDPNNSCLYKNTEADYYSKPTNLLKSKYINKSVKDTVANSALSSIRKTKQ